MMGRAPAASRRALLGRIARALPLVTPPLLLSCGKDEPPPPPPPPPPPAPPPAPTLLSLTITADQGLNPGPGGGSPSPVVLRLLQLTDITAFNAADWFVLSAAGAGDLGGTVVVAEERLVTPGATTVYQRRVEDGARYLGAVAGFKDLAGVWRGYFPLPPETTSLLELELAGSNLVLRRAGL